MLTEEQIDAIAEAVSRKSGKVWNELTKRKQTQARSEIAFIASKAIAIQAESDRRSFIAVANYIGVRFTAETDVVSEVYAKLDEILAAFREHSQEIEIAQQSKTLIKLLEKYDQQKTEAVRAGAVGEETGNPVCNGVPDSDNTGQGISKG